MSTPVKKNKNTLKNEKNNLLKAKRTLNIKMSSKRCPVFTFSLPGGRLTSLPPFN